MNAAPRASTRHRLAGLVLAATGVVLARFVAPVLDPGVRSVVALIGTMVAASGLYAIALGVRHRLRAEAGTTAASPSATPGPSAHAPRA